MTFISLKWRLLDVPDVYWTSLMMCFTSYNIDWYVSRIRNISLRGNNWREIKIHAFCLRRQKCLAIAEMFCNGRNVLQRQKLSYEMLKWGLQRCISASLTSTSHNSISLRLTPFFHSVSSQNISFRREKCYGSCWHASLYYKSLKTSSGTSNKRQVHPINKRHLTSTFYKLFMLVNFSSVTWRNLCVNHFPPKKLAPDSKSLCQVTQMWCHH